jgi:hypothetical protein
MLVGRSPAGTSEFSACASLFSQFKVQAMRVRINFPWSRENSTGTDPNTVVFGYSNDSGGLTLFTYNQILAIRDSYECSAYGSCEYSVVLPKATMSGASSPLSPAIESEWCDTVTPNYLYGAVAIAWDTNAGDDLGGSITVEYDVVFRGRY